MRCGAAASTSSTARARLFHARSSMRQVTLVAVRLSTLRMSNPPVLSRKFMSPSRRAAREGNCSAETLVLRAVARVERAEPGAECRSAGFPTACDAGAASQRRPATSGPGWRARENEKSGQQDEDASAHVCLDDGARRLSVEGCGGQMREAGTRAAAPSRPGRRLASWTF